MDYSFAIFPHFASPVGSWADSLTREADAEESPFLYSDDLIQNSAEGENESAVVDNCTRATANVLHTIQRHLAWEHVTANGKQRLHYQRRLSQALRQSKVELPEMANRVSQELLDALLEFKPHQMGISLVVDEEQEASIVFTAYWPTNTLHVEHFFHFPAEDPNDTVVNYYLKPADSNQLSQRQWGWHCPVGDFSNELRGQLRNGQWPLQGGW